MDREFDLFTLLIFLAKRRLILFIGLISGVCAGLAYLAYRKTSLVYRSTVILALKETAEMPRDQWLGFASTTAKLLQTEASFKVIYAGLEPIFNQSAEKAYAQQTIDRSQTPIAVATNDTGSQLQIVFESEIPVESSLRLNEAVHKFMVNSVEAIKRENQKDTNASDIRMSEVATWKFVNAQQEIFELLSKTRQDYSMPYIGNESNAFYRTLSAIAVLEKRGIITAEKSKEYQDIVYRSVAALNALNTKPNFPGYNPEALTTYLSELPVDMISAILNEEVHPQTKNKNLRFVLIIIAGIVGGFAVAMAMEYYEYHQSRLKKLLQDINQTKAAHRVS